MVARCVRERRRIMRYRLPTSSLKKLESRKFTKNEIYDTCAICLDDYEEGDRLRWVDELIKPLNGDHFHTRFFAEFFHVVMRTIRNASTFGSRRTEGFVRFVSVKSTRLGSVEDPEEDSQPTRPATPCLLLTRTTQHLWSIRKTVASTMGRSMRTRRERMTNRWSKELNRTSHRMTRFSMVVNPRDSKDSIHLIVFLIFHHSSWKNWRQLACLLKNLKVVGLALKGESFLNQKIFRKSL